MRKKIGIAMLLLALLLVPVIFLVHNNSIRNAEEEYRIINLIDKNWFGTVMNFEYRIVYRTGSILSYGDVAMMLINPRSMGFDPFYTGIIFVHNEEEAAGFPDNIIVAWPRTEASRGDYDLNFSEGLIAGIHWAVDRTEEDLQRISWTGTTFQLRPVVTLEEFGLTYPLTVVDLVDNWEKVNALWSAFDSDERSLIRREASFGGWRGSRN